MPWLRPTTSLMRVASLRNQACRAVVQGRPRESAGSCQDSGKPALCRAGNWPMLWGKVRLCWQVLAWSAHKKATRGGVVDKSNRAMRVKELGWNLPIGCGSSSSCFALQHSYGISGWASLGGNNRSHLQQSTPSWAHQAQQTIISRRALAQSRCQCVRISKQARQLLVLSLYGGFSQA